MGAKYETANFQVVNAPTPELAKAFCETAEHCRAELAVLWTGKPMPNWSARCPILVKVGEKLGPGGATTFVFNNGEVYGWEMDIQGSAQRIIDSVLPHEITHMILASHFRRPIPRWLDEGAATSVEHNSERDNYRRMLLKFLREDVRKGLPFNRMVALKEYPSDPMPLYAQGFSVVEYLLNLGGHERFMQFAGTGMKSGNWNAAVQQHYGIESLGRLQLTWVDWVASGFPAVQPLTAIAAAPVRTPITASLNPQPNTPAPLLESSAETPQPPFASVYAAGLDHKASRSVSPAPGINETTVLLEWKAAETVIR